MKANELARAELQSMAIQLAVLPNRIMAKANEDDLCMQSVRDLVEMAIGLTVSTLEQRFDISVSDFVVGRCCTDDAIKRIPVNHIAEAFWDMINN